VPQVRSRSLAANVGSLADAMQYLKLSFTKQFTVKQGLWGRSGRSVYYDRDVRDERELVANSAICMVIP
jgi:hypothetical protein